MSSGWRVHDDVLLPAETRAESNSDEFENSGAELVIPPIEIYRPSQGGYDSVDWVVAQLTSTVTLVERYRALIASRSFFSKTPSKSAFYPVNVASQHLLGVAYIAAQSIAQKVPFPEHQYQIAQTLATMFVFSWKLIADKKKSRALTDLDFVLAKPPQGLPPITDEELFRRLKDRDLEGAGYNMKTVTELKDLDNKAKGKPVEQLVFSLINYFLETRNVFTNNKSFDSISDPKVKSTCLLALRQAGLYVRYFASAILEPGDPKQSTRTFRLLDELTDVTHDLAQTINDLDGAPKPSVGGYSPGGSGSTGYISGDVSFLDQVSKANKTAPPIGYEHVAETDEYSSNLIPYVNAQNVIEGVKKPSY